MKLRVFCILACVILLAGFAACKQPATDDPAILPLDTPVDVTEIGEGIRSFRLDVTDKEGSTTSFLVHTNELFIGSALSELGFLEGSFTDFGVLIKSVNGIPVDFTADRAFWGFYVNGSFADTTQRIDQIEITDDLTIIYSLRWTTA